MATITLEVPESLARLYEKVTFEDRARMEAIFRAWVEQTANRPKLSLMEAMDRLSDEAEANGLTPEILEDLLRDED